MTDAATLEQLLGWEDVLDDSSYYELLGVLEICDGEALRQAYHEFALIFHPDLYRGQSEAVQTSVRRIFQRGTEAYRVLTDRDLRVRYDMALTQGKRRLEEALVPKGDEPPPPASVRSRPLDELARSAGAKLCAQKAAKLIEKGDLAGAKAEIVKAMSYDGDANPGLKERLEALELALNAGGT